MSSAFYNSDPAPSGRGWLIYPIRRLLRRIQRPYYFKLQTAIDDITAQLNQVRHELNQTRQELSQAHHELGKVRQQVRALGVDHTAVIRRLISIEDQVVTTLAQAEDAPYQPRLLAAS